MESLLWSIAFPGFGQLINKKYIKGLTFIFLEILINSKGNFNEVIMLSFQGHIPAAIESANYGWLMFYPCLYLFALWDAFRDAGASKYPYAYIPFVLAAYLVTVGLMYSPHFTIFGVLLGPVWLPILCCLIGIAAGWAIRKLLVKRAFRSPQ